MANDMFAPPTKEEVDNAMFAPPSKEELGDPDPNSLKGQALLDFMHSGKDQSALGRANLKSLPGAVPDAAAHAFGLIGGFSRTAIAGTAGLLKDQNPVTKEDWANAMISKAPSTDEYMQRFGVPEGPSVLGPFSRGPSMRSAVGFLGDVATDPLTWAASAGKTIKPISEGVESLGKSVYKSGLKKVDERLIERGVKPLSDVLLEHGAPTGTTKKIAEEAKNINSASLSEREALYEQVKAAKEKVDIGAAAKKAKKYLAEIVDADDPALEEVAKQLQDRLDRYTAKGFIDVDKASRWKTNIYNSLPQSAYDQHGRMLPQVQDFMKKLGSDFRQAIIDAGEKAEKGLGNKIDKANETMGSIIQAKKPLAMQIRRGETPNLVTSVDGMLAAGTALASHDPTTTAAIMAAKKAADLSKTTYARTKAGKGLIRLGKTGLLEGVSSHGLINEQNQSQP